MIWVYHQDSGLIRRAGRPIAHGYSGNGEGKNNHNLQHLRGLGPIPCGAYWIGEPRDSLHTGPFILPLTPLIGTETFARSAFEIHGDSTEHPGDASHGCLVFSRAVREVIAADRGQLLVLPPLEQAVA